ncbi:MAG: hypothetical protein AAFX98_07025, partial [Pseudomonadota bacterium]
GPEMADWLQYTLGVGITTIGWVTVTLLTSPETDTAQSRFKELAWPQGDLRRELMEGLGLAVAAIAGTYGFLFGVGFLLYGNLLWAVINLGVAALTCIFVVLRIRGLAPAEQVATTE